MLTTISLSGLDVIIYRDDLNHTTVSGNKLHKLTPNIEKAKAHNCSKVLSYGGPYSNHLHALAWACKQAGLSSIGAVRGELHTSLTPTLVDCKRWSMQLIPMSRRSYREHQDILTSYSDPCLASDLDLKFGLKILGDGTDTLVVPEGGSNLAAIKSLKKAYQGVFDLIETRGVTHVICATGTGATVAGLYQAAPTHVRVIGMQAVAEQDATLMRIQTWLEGESKRLSIVESHLGKFAKVTPKLTEFIEQFELRQGIPLDPVYNGKALLKLTTMIEADYFDKTDKILFVHTGGLQGKRGDK